MREGDFSLRVPTSHRSYNQSEYTVFVDNLPNSCGIPWFRLKGLQVGQLPYGTMTSLKLKRSFQERSSFSYEGVQELIEHQGQRQRGVLQRRRHRVVVQSGVGFVIAWGNFGGQQGVFFFVIAGVWQFFAVVGLWSSGGVFLVEAQWVSRLWFDGLPRCLVFSMESSATGLGFFLFF
ncbi:hypothetical protein RHMOL_Rhmol06G0201900 [Rhododendron molle]|uniref:Uncharacterized protein n=1 Tax=Rhododendron molle TaxID=49168 RepID=A0ACC0NFX8_RHOML|nr:hypothetical protein RHMOL_Rhmol06G0201900 [Rhododendron molle]